MSLQVGKAIYNLLSNDANVTGRVQNKIYPLIADTGTTFPFIVYRRTGIEPSDSKDRFIYKEDTYVEVAIASDKYNESIEIADSVKDALQGKRGNYSGINIQDIRMTNADEDYIEDTFIQNLTFNIKTNGRTSKDSGGKWVAKAARKISWNCSTENLYSNDGEGMTFDQLFDKLTARTPIKAVFCLEKDYSTKKDEVPEGGWLPATTGIYSGNVIITALEANAPNGDNATFTASFEGVGALTKTA